jgi:hypothetical protein
MKPGTGVEGIAARQHVPGRGERLTMVDGSVWLHPFNGAAPVWEPHIHDWRRAGRVDPACVVYKCRTCGETYEKDYS